MHPVRIGRIVRSLRRRRGWRQSDLGARAGVSQQSVSLVETGRYRSLAIDTLERILAELEAGIEVVVRWRGGELDRVVDAGHADLEGGLTALLVKDGWLVQVEVTYSIGGDRGSIDLLAFRPESAALLISEIKTDVTSAEGTLRRHDEKVRLGAAIARQRYGWVATSVSRLLVVPDASTPRRRIRSHAPVFDQVYPMRGHAVRRWLRQPKGALAGLLFLPATKIVGVRRELASRRRIARSRRPAAEHVGRPVSSRSGQDFIDSSGEHQGDW